MNIIRTSNFHCHIKKCCRNFRQQIVLFAIILCWSANDMMAHTTQGSTPLANATATITEYGELIKQLMQIIVCMMVIGRTFALGLKMQDGNPDVMREIRITIERFIAFIVLSEILPLFFH